MADVLTEREKIESKQEKNLINEEIESKTQNNQRSADFTSSKTEKDTERKTDSQAPIPKNMELPELIRSDPKAAMPIGLPPINVSDLKNILKGPNMPTYMAREVSEMFNKEYESDDNSTSSTGSVAMTNLFDCILDVSIAHGDSDNESDDEYDSIPRTVICKFCDKVFDSIVSMRTHILVAHSLQEPAFSNKEIEKRRSSSHLKQDDLKNNARENETTFRTKQRSKREQSENVKDISDITETARILKHESPAKTPDDRIDKPSSPHSLGKRRNSSSSSKEGSKTSDETPVKSRRITRSTSHKHESTTEKGNER